MSSLQSKAVLFSVQSILLLSSTPEKPRFRSSEWKLTSNANHITALPDFSFDLLQFFVWKQSAENCFFLLLSSLASLPDPLDGLQELSFPLSPEIVSFLKPHHLSLSYSLPEGCNLLSFSSSESTINLTIIIPLLLDSFKTDAAIDPSQASILYQSLWKLLGSHFSLRSPGFVSLLLSRLVTEKAVGVIETALQWVKEKIEKKSEIADILLPLVPPIASWCDAPFLFKRQAKVVKKALLDVKESCEGNALRSEVKSLLDSFVLTPEKKPRKRKGRKRVFNRNPAVNAMLEEEEEKQDNYDDLVDFIDPTPDHSLQNGTNLPFL